MYLGIKLICFKTKVNSKEVKAKLQKYLETNGFNMSCTEFVVYGGYLADVFSLQRNGYTQEWEIKVSKDDWFKELESLEVLYDGIGDADKTFKYSKHWAYTQKEYMDKTAQTNSIVPNKFCYIVPIELYEKWKDCYLLAYIEKAGYGLYTIDKDKYYWCVKKVISPKFLHKRKQNVLPSFAQRCWRENMNNIKIVTNN